jgi:four helix bundle protein
MGYEHLKRRTFRFAVDAIRTARPLLHDPLGRHLVGQVIRSSSSVGANYDAACNARSRADFAAKVSIVAEEASETGFWFRLFVALELLAHEGAEPIVTEARELASIATASAQTAKGRRHPPAHQRA